jgi:hypothetical protein
MVVGRIRFSRPPCPARSARLPATLETYPGKTATEFVTLASTDGRPMAIRLGKVISEPPPASALIAPAARPATTSRAM